MEHTYRLGANANTTGKADQAAFYLVGILGIFVGMLTLFSSQQGMIGLVSGSTLIIAGLISLHYAIKSITVNSRFAPKVIIRNQEIEIKPTFYTKTSVIRFDEMASVCIGKRVLSVTLIKSGKTRRFRTNGSYPFEIREALAHIATRRNLELR